MDLLFNRPTIVMKPPEDSTSSSGGYFPIKSAPIIKKNKEKDKEKNITQKIPSISNIADPAVQAMLRELDRITLLYQSHTGVHTIAKLNSCIFRSEKLIYSIVQSIRKEGIFDRLFHTTSVWIFLSLYRLLGDEIKDIMLKAGVSSILYDFLNKNMLEGSSRIYASQLINFLTQETKSISIYKINNTISKQIQPPISVITTTTTLPSDADESSVISDISSVVGDLGKNHLPFVPFRVTSANMEEVEASYNHDKPHQFASTLPHSSLLSSFGFQVDKKIKLRPIKYKDNFNINEDDYNDNDNDEFNQDNMSTDSTLSSETHLHSLDSHSVNLQMDMINKNYNVKLNSLIKNSNILKPVQYITNNDDDLSIISSNSDFNINNNINNINKIDRLTHSDVGFKFPGVPSSLATKKKLNPKTFLSRSASTPFGLGGYSKMNQISLDEDDENGSNEDTNNFPPQRLSSAPHRLVHQLRGGEPSSKRSNVKSASGQRELKKSTVKPNVSSSFLPLHALPTFGADDSVMEESSEMNGVFKMSSFFSEPEVDPAIEKEKALRDSYAMLGISRNSESFDDNNRGLESLSSYVDIVMNEIDPLDLSDINKPIENMINPRKLAFKDGQKELQDWLKENDSKYEPGESDIISEDKNFFNEALKQVGTTTELMETTEDVVMKQKLKEEEEKMLEQRRIMEEELMDDLDNEDIDNEQNTFTRQRLLRLRAEKLIDHSFVRSLFLKNAKKVDTQSLISRLEKLLLLIDKEKTGYVTFESFARVIIAVSPPHLLRKDVEEFINYQTSNLQDMIDYNEFIISGKVLLITQSQHSILLERKNLNGQVYKKNKDLNIKMSEDEGTPNSTAVWLNRQKQYTGESSTYTWKNHLKWYQKRKAEALIWLIRRATRSFEHEKRLKRDYEFLLVKSKQAQALSDLLELGRGALQTQDKRMRAKCNLISRVIHARKYCQKAEVSLEYLKANGQSALREFVSYLQAYERKEEERHQQMLQEEERLRQEQLIIPNVVKKAPPKYETLFKIKELQKLAINYLRGRSQQALDFTLKQHQAFEWLVFHSNKVKTQLVKHRLAQRELMLRAEIAHKYCCQRDFAWIYLIQRGEKAVKLINAYEESVEKLKEYGKNALHFLSTKGNVAIELATLGRKTLSFMNARENAFSYLTNRIKKSQDFLQRKREAIKYLKKRPLGMWHVYENYQNCFEWLKEKGQRALNHEINKIRVFQSLKYIGNKSTAIARKRNLALIDLNQIGLSNYINFFVSVIIKQNPDLQLRLKKEYNILSLFKIERTEKIKSFKWGEKLLFDLKLSYNIISLIYSPGYLNNMSEAERINLILETSEESIENMKNAKSVLHSPNSPYCLHFYTKDPYLGRYGFRRLFKNGKLLNMNEDSLDYFFDNIDINGKGYIRYSHLQPFFIKQVIKLKKKDPTYDFTIEQIFTDAELASYNLFNIMNKEKDGVINDDGRFEELKRKKRSQIEAKRRAAAEAAKNIMASLYESSDDESEVIPEEDEDAVFSDIDRLKSMDVGKLMKYLTKKQLEEEDKKYELIIQERQKLREIEEKKENDENINHQEESEKKNIQNEEPIIIEEKSTINEEYIPFDFNSLTLDNNKDKNND